MIISSIFIVLAYTISLLWAFLGIKKLPEIPQLDNGNPQQFSVIVVFRNELENLPVLINSLKALDYSTLNFEILFIDDHSKDGGAAYLDSQLKESNIDYTIKQNKHRSNSPKKDAITQAVEIAKFDWIITIDADCQCTTSWLKLFSAAVNSSNTSLILGPVILNAPSQKLLYIWQQVEHLGLQQFAKGSAGQKVPILANGANLAYSKDFFKAVNGFEGNNHLASGDDLFMLEKATQSGQNIVYLNSPKAAVSTNAEESWQGAINQRVRWSAKSSASNSALLKGIGMLIGLSNLWVLVLLIWLGFNAVKWQLLLGFLGYKIVLDYIFLTYKSQQNKSVGLVAIVLAVFSYPFVLLSITTKGFVGGYTWKQRSFKK